MEELRLKHIRRRRKIRFIIILIIVNALLGWNIGWKIGRALMIKESSEKTDTAFKNIVENNQLNIDENEVSDEFNNYDVEENYEISDYEEDNNEESITYFVEDENVQDIQNRLQSWNFQREDNKKIAYLTFDDGPSENVTPQILDILDKNDVKATFFVLGTAIEDGEKQKELLRRMDEEGHAIANHGYSHNYKILYPNGVVDASAFISDIKRTEEIINETLRYEYNNKVIRFPGGHASWNTNTVDSILEVEGYTYIDWNSLNGDAEGSYRSKEELKEELYESVSSINGNNDILVILMHDTDEKLSTVEALDDSIKYLKSLGYEFRTLKFLKQKVERMR